MEFDANLDLDVVHAPRGWLDPELFVQPADWLEGMRALLDQHLTAQGEQPLNDTEWQVINRWLRITGLCTVTMAVCMHLQEHSWCRTNKQRKSDPMCGININAHQSLLLFWAFQIV
jgi:hypothetical protein